MGLKVGIICAGDREVDPFIPCIKDCGITDKAMLKFYQGTINGVKIVTLFSGVCKVNAAIATQILIDCYNVDLIINSGTAGGISEEVDLFDTVISTEVAYHDVNEGILTEFHPWLKSIYFSADSKLLKLSHKAVDKQGKDYKVFFGRMVTGEAFISDDGREEINALHTPLSVDMETASIAHVCYVNKIPFIAIRTITDTAKHSGAEHFDRNCIKASIIAKDITLALLDEIRTNYSL